MPMINEFISGRFARSLAKILFLIVPMALFIVPSSSSQQKVENNGTAEAGHKNTLKNGAVLYKTHCGGCHGQQLQGSAAPALVGKSLKHGVDHSSILKSIRDGFASTEMAPYSDILSVDQIEQLAAYIIAARKSPSLIESYGKPSEVQTKHYHLHVEQVTSEGLEKPWGFDFVSQNRILVTFNKGELRWLVDGKVDPKPIQGIPKIYGADMYGGLMDVILDPDYQKNRWIYLAYSYNSIGTTDKNAPGTTKIIRGKIRDHHWVDEQVLFQAPESLFVTGGVRWGSRFLFDKQGYLYFTIGEMLSPKGGGGRRPQLLTRPEGKIFRINSDGTIPHDNPLYGKDDALQAIYSWGTRNVQGIAQHPATGEIYFSDHGPKGGDELNRLKRGANYGWPDITYGIDYDGTVISNKTHQKGMEQPLTYWTPSLAVSGIEFVTGNRFPKWKNDLLVTALKFEEVRRLVIKGDTVEEQEILLKGYGRLRDIKIGPDGALYVLTNAPDALWRITPSQKNKN